MGDVLVVLCPGQGAQTPGFLSPWLDVDGCREQLEAWSAAVGFDLVATGTEPDADVVDTAVAQPLLVAAGLTTARLLGPLPTTTALVGHSVGEITAAGIAGALRADDGLAFARQRGRAMAAAATVAPSGMTAILGGDPDEVAAVVGAAGCWLANYNAPGQLVAAGARDALQRLADAPPAGARLRPLAVAGAFHTPLMQPALDELSELPLTPAAHMLRHVIVSNADGGVVTTAEDLLRRLLGQIVAPVRFDLCLQTLQSLGVTATLEVAPGGVLTAIIKRALPDVTAVALRSPDDLDDARRLVRDHADVGDVTSLEWRLVVAPASGTLLRDERINGSLVYPSDSLALVSQRSGSVTISSPVSGEVVEWLVEDGDPVQQGQPVARIAPAVQ